MIDAVVFDMDGVLIESEEVWDAVREEYVRERGGRYDAGVQHAMMGMSSVEWSRYLHEAAGVADEPEQINDEVVRRMLAAYREHLPLVPGAVEAVRRVAARYPLALASSSNRPPSYPPDEEALAQADVVIRSLDVLTPELIGGGSA